MTSKRKSLRGELLGIVILSMVLAVVTEGFIICALWIIFQLTGQDIKTSLEMNNTCILEPPRFSESFEYANQEAGKAGNPLGTYYIPKYFIAFLALLIVVGLILFLLYYVTLTKKFSQYIEEITYGIQEISIGNFENKIPIRTNDEMALVAEKLNDMSENIYLLLCDERQNEDVKNELITSVAHDIRTPLTSIIGYLYLAVYRKDLEEEIREKYLQIAYDKSKRLERLTEDLFSYTKYSTDEVKLHYECIDLVKFMEQMVDEFYPSFKSSGLEYEFNCEMKVAIILADGNMLARAIGNLVSNAIKYGSDGKYICIEVKQEDEYAKVSVLNYGAIIPKEDLKHIFERFYRVENSRCVETGGTGLGLPIAKRIIELHNGSIEVKSDFEGTVFEVRLKLYNQEEEQVHEGQKEK